MATAIPSSVLSITNPCVLKSLGIWDISNSLQAAVEVEEMEPTNPAIAATMQAMKDRGVGMMYGRWLIEGAPRVLLFDTKTAYGYMDEWKADLWNVASIPSPPNDDETNEAVVFGYLVAWFLGEVRATTTVEPG
jgi:glycogen(starch) synthase